MTDRSGYLVWFLIALLVGFCLCRLLAGKKREEYVKLETVQGSAGNNRLIPVGEEMPVNPFLPVIIDTVYLTAKVDTAAIISDYILKRYYSITAFDSKETGTLKLFPTVQYNQLSGLDYEFTPIQRQVINSNGKVWQAFLSGSYSTANYVYLGGDVFYHNLGFEYQYQKDLFNKNDGHLFGIKYKF